MSEPWMFWGFGGGLGLVGLLLLGWAILWDRPEKGQKRCPKCWYDLSHPGLASDHLRCSECGYRAKSEKKLSKTRRKWRWAGLGMLVVVGGIYLLAFPKAKKDGWISLVPDSVLILCITSDTESWAAKELFVRLFPTPLGPAPAPTPPGTPAPVFVVKNPAILWSWQWRWLAWRLGHTSMRSNPRFASDKHDVLLMSIASPWNESAIGRLQRAMRSDDIDQRNEAAVKLHRILFNTEHDSYRVEFVRSLLEFLDEQTFDEQDRTLLGLLNRPWPEMQPAVPRLIAQLDREPIDSMRHIAARSLAGIGPYAKAALEPLLEGLPQGRPDLPIYFLNLEAVCAIDPTNDVARRHLQRYLEDDSIYIGYRFEASEVWITGQFEPEPLLDFWTELAQAHSYYDRALKEQMARYLDLPENFTVHNGIMMLRNRVEP